MIPMEEGVFNVRTASVSAIAGEPRCRFAVVAIVLATPIMLVCAGLVRLDSPGPVLFRQARVGFNRQTFQVLKFRTMAVDDPDDGSIGVSRHDPRIARVGGWLRRLSLDELPQLFNVLTGNMSVVGPRPHVPGMLVGTDAYSDALRE